MVGAPGHSGHRPDDQRGSRGPRLGVPTGGPAERTRARWAAQNRRGVSSVTSFSPDATVYPANYSFPGYTVAISFLTVTL